MKEPGDLTAVLDRCLERLARGEALDTILGDYPGFARELRPLLAAAAAFEEAAPLAEEEWKARARRDVMLHLPARPRVSADRPPAALRRL